jgi:DNA polymerase/3'-5' exonuclease PolX
MIAINQDIVDMLQRMQRLRVEQGEVGKVHGYVRAIRAIQSYPVRITSAEQALTIPGIGPSMSQRIGEFLTTGRVAELAGLDQKDQVIKLFTQIDRVGLDTAERWYRAGYRTLSDVPRSACNDGQWIGLTLYPELSQRIPRSEIDVYNQYLTQFLGALKIHFIICGSYRRGKETSGDIDVVILDQPGRQIFNEVLSSPMFTHTLALGSKKFLGVCKLPGGIHRRIDLELAQPYEYVATVTYFTGPASFNVKMRDHADKIGYHLNEKALTRQGQIISLNSEDQLFTILGLRYLTPKERDGY